MTITDDILKELGEKEETKDQYLTRIGAKNNKPKQQHFGRFDDD